MSARGRLAAVVAVLAAGFPLAVPADAAAPSRLLVRASEWSLQLSRPAVKRGPVIVQLHNWGEDAHDLVIRRLANGRATGAARKFAETPSGELTQRTIRLRAGRYRLLCSLPGHAAAGMRATLRVR
jgi:hypothetical protein